MSGLSWLPAAFAFRIGEFTPIAQRTLPAAACGLLVALCGIALVLTLSRRVRHRYATQRKEVKERVKKLKKAYEITDAKIQFVSLVDKAANMRTFLLTKAEEGKKPFATYGRIVKSDAETHWVTGVVYEPMVEDAHGNFMTEDEIIKAAYWFAKNGDKVDLQHSFEPLQNACVVESWIAKADFQIGEQSVKKGTWLMTMEITDDDIWSAIEKGEFTGFSMGGVGNYSEEDTDLSNIEKEQEPGKKGLLMQLAKALGLNVVEKGEVTELYAERNTCDSFWNAFYALFDCLMKYDYNTGTYVWAHDEETVKGALADFDDIVQGLLTGGQSITKAIFGDSQDIVKSGKALSGKNKEKLQGICDDLTAFLASFADPEEDTGAVEKAAETEPQEGGETIQKEEIDMTKAEVEQIVTEAVAKAMNPAQQEATPAAATENPVEKQQEKTPEITAEAIEKMVSAAIEKAMTPKEEPVTMEQVNDMITKAVEKALAPVMKAKGLPTNLDSSTAKPVEKKAEPHYLAGII